jgi:hypothetical protein
MASKVTFSTNKLNRLNQRATMKGLDALTFSFQRRVKKMLSKPGTGRKRSGQNYAPSVSPNPPAVQSGRLRNSWVAGRKKRKTRPGKVSIFLTQGAGFADAAKYGYILEKGLGNLKGKKREFIKPSIKLFRGGRAQRIFSSVFRREVAKINKGGPYG